MTQLHNAGLLWTRRGLRLLEQVWKAQASRACGLGPALISHKGRLKAERLTALAGAFYFSHQE